MADCEVIIVDDGSTDNSREEVEKFLHSVRDERFRLIHQANNGPGAARNRGIAEARAPLVAFLDADDEWLPHFLENAIQALARSGPGTAAISTAWFDDPGHRSSRERFMGLGLRTGLYTMSSDTDPRLLLALHIMMSPCCTIVRKEVVQRLGGFYEKRCRFGEDGHLWLKVCLNYPVYILFEEGAVFHRENSALSGNRSMRPVEPFLEDPEDVRAVCPPNLSRLLENLLAIRAMKTSCVLAYWGEWRRARLLRRRYSVAGAWRLPWYFPSLLTVSPLGSLAGAGLRALRGSS